MRFPRFPSDGRTAERDSLGVAQRLGSPLAVIASAWEVCGAFVSPRRNVALVGRHSAVEVIKASANSKLGSASPQLYFRAQPNVYLFWGLRSVPQFEVGRR